MAAGEFVTCEQSRPPKQPRRKLSKAELREQAAAAFLAWREGQTTKDT
jgi:hypothetical protein